MKEEKQLLPGGMYRGVENKIKVKTLNYVIVVLFILLTCIVIYLTKQGGYTITFETNGGSTLAAQRYKYGEVIELESPEKIGYTFDGWYIDEDLTQLLSKEMGVENHMTLYAKYTPLSYTISFNVGDSTLQVPTSVKREFMSQYGELPILSLNNKTFIGWALDNQLIDSKTIVTLNGNHTLTAVFK